MSFIDLFDNNLTEFTESDLKALCDLNELKYDELTELDLEKNKLINLDFITSNTPFINLRNLYINYNKIRDISNLKYLINLKTLNINGLNLNNEKETVNMFKTMNLKYLYGSKVLKTYTVNKLKKELPNIEIII